MSVQSGSPRRFFVGVGISHPTPRGESGSLRDLPRVRDDIGRMRQDFAKAFNFEVVDLATNQADPSDAELTAGEFRRQMDSWFKSQSLNQSDALVLYFSGHGLLSTKTNQLFLCFRDFDTSAPGGDGGIEVGAFLNLVIDRDTAPGNIWIILDCCSSGTTSGIVDLIAQAWKSSGGPKTVWVTAACGPFSFSYDGRFSRAFVDAVRAVTSPGDLDEQILKAMGSRAPQQAKTVSFGHYNFLQASRPESVPPAIFRPRRRARWQVALAAASLTALSLVGFLAWGGRLRQTNPGVDAPPSDMVAIAGGVIHMGSTEADARWNYRACRDGYGDVCGTTFESSLFAREVRSPAYDRALVPAFYIDRSEVSHREFVRWLNSEAKALAVSFHGVDGAIVVNGWGQVLVAVRTTTDSAATTPIRRDEGAYFIDHDWADRPVILVSWQGARSFCAAAKKRLPSEEEWELAARGHEQRTYPWGSAAPAGCESAVFGRTDHGVCHSAARFPEPVASNARDVTPDGVRDLGGNVSEWTASVYSGPDTGPPCLPSPGDSCRAVRGGSFTDGALMLRASTRSRAPGERLLANGGFRCARDR